MANILLLKDVASIPGITITMDSLVERAILVKDGNITLKFKECRDGLYFYDTAVTKTNTLFTPYCFLSTVKANEKFYAEIRLKRHKMQDFCTNTLGGLVPTTLRIFCETIIEKL